MKTNSALVEMFIEFKWDVVDDPFGDVYESASGQRFFVCDTKTTYDTLGQITSYAAAHLNVQFRTHIFSVLIVRDTARLLWWDRTGTIVTEAFRYNECPILAEFFSRYSTASDARHSKDESISEPSNMEKAMARQNLGYDKNVPLVKLSIPDLDGLHYFITSTPEATLYTPPGHATHGFKAYDISGEDSGFCEGLVEDRNVGYPSRGEGIQGADRSQCPQYSPLHCIRRYFVCQLPCYKDPYLFQRTMGL